jgi:hypothetical protein
MASAFIKDIRQSLFHFYNRCRFLVQSSTIQLIMVSVILQLIDHSAKLSIPNIFHLAIELASGEYGMDKVKTLSNFIGNGECLSWFGNPSKVLKLEQLRQLHPISEKKETFKEVGEMQQLKVLLRRGVIKAKRDQTLTHLRISMNILVALMLGWLYIGSGYDGSRVIANYNLMFAILIHHVFSTMMLTILTCKC